MNSLKGWNGRLGFFKVKGIGVYKLQFLHQLFFFQTLQHTHFCFESVFLVTLLYKPYDGKIFFCYISCFVFRFFSFRARVSCGVTRFFFLSDFSFGFAAR